LLNSRLFLAPKYAQKPSERDQGVNRKLKNLGLALVAALALSGVAAQVAAADEIHSGSVTGTTYMTLDQHAKNVVDVAAGNIQCSTIGGEAQFSGTTATQVTVTNVTFSSCTGMGLTAHIDTMGCDYLGTGVTATTGLVHIICPTTAGGVTDEITVTPTQGGQPVCHMDVPEQTVSVEVVNKAATGGGIPDAIEVKPTSTSITSRVTYLGGQTPGKCGTAGLQHDGKYTNGVTITGFQDAAYTERVGLTYT
jgi:hypothetical protein